MKFLKTKETIFPTGIATKLTFLCQKKKEIQMKKKEQVEVLMETLTKIKNKLKLGNILSGWKMSNNILQNNKS